MLKIIVFPVGSNSSLVRLPRFSIFGNDFLHTNASLITASSLFFCGLAADISATSPQCISKVCLWLMHRRRVADNYIST